MSVSAALVSFRFVPLTAPAYCSRCSGSGSVDAYDFIDYGSTSKRVLVGQDDCPSCLARGVCPSCGSALLPDRRCSCCGWALEI